MALGEKYIASFESLGGDTYGVSIYVEGFSGDPEAITMGTPPFTLQLSGENDDRFSSIKPQSLTLNLMSMSRLQFQDLFSNVEENLKVIITKNSNPFWEGWILPDQYQEPYESAPYPVSITAVCGLERLRAYEWDYAGARQDGITMLANIFDRTGLRLDFYTACNVYESRMTTGTSADPIAQTYISEDAFYDTDGEPLTYWDALDHLLSALGCQVRQIDGAWHVIRLAENAGSYVRRRYTRLGALTQHGSHNPSASVAFNNRAESLEFLPIVKSEAVRMEYGRIGNLVPANFDTDSFYLDGANLEVTGFTRVGGVTIGKYLSNFAGRAYALALYGNASSESDASLHLVNNQTPGLLAGAGNAIMIRATFMNTGIYSFTPSSFFTARLEVKVGSYYLVGDADDPGTIQWQLAAGVLKVDRQRGGFQSLSIQAPSLAASGVLTVKLLQIFNGGVGTDIGIVWQDVQVDALPAGEWQPQAEVVTADIQANSSYTTEERVVYLGDAPASLYHSAFTLSSGDVTENWARSGVTESRRRHRILLQDIINHSASSVWKLSADITGFNHWWNTCVIDGKTYMINGGRFNPNTDTWSVVLLQAISTDASSTVTSQTITGEASASAGIGGNTGTPTSYLSWGSIPGKPANDTQWSDELGLAPGFFTFEAEELARVRGFVAVDALALWADMQSLMDRKAEAGHSILAGTGLSGGGLLTADRTLSLANTAVTPGTYGSTIQAPEIIIDAQGRITSAVNRTIRDASPSQSGVVSTGTQRFAGSKIFELGVFLEAAAVLESLGATVGFSGAGLAVRKVTDEWKMDIDSLLIRGALFATELIVNQISAVNGSDILSPGRGKIETYTPGAEPFDVTVSDPQGGNFASFAVGDIVLIQQVRPNDSAVVKRIIKEVDGVSGRTVSLISTAGAPADVGTIEPGDVMVSIGNVSNANRRASIYRSVTDANNPFVRVFTGVDSWGDWLHQDRISLAYGNLNGSYGYETSIYGFAAGDYSGANITMDPTNGLRLRDGSLVLAQLSGDTFTIGDLNNYFAFNASLATLALNINGALNLNETDGLTLEVSATETTDGAKAVKWMSGGDVYSSMLGVDVTDGLVGGLWYSDFGLTMYAAGLGLGLDAGWRLLLPSDGSGGQFPAISVHSDNANSYRTVIEMRSRDAGVALRLLIPELPLSSSGLPTGAVYVDSGTLKIVT